MKQFKVAKTDVYKVWANNEEEAQAMFDSQYKFYYAKKYNIDILSFELDGLKEPWNWKEVKKGQAKYYEWDSIRDKNEPTQEIVVVKALQEREERIIKMIKEYLEFNYPIEEDDDHIAWHWDTQSGVFELLACAFGDNFYDYGEEPKETVIDDSVLAAMVEKYPEYFFILDCSGCCRCAGW